MNAKKMLTRLFLTAAITLVGTVGVAGANGQQCADGKGNPHYCWQPDVDPTFTMTTETTSAEVKVNKIVTLEADCVGTDSYAMGGGYTVMPKDATIGYVVKAKVLNTAPVFTGTPLDSAPHGWTVTVVNHAYQTATVTAFATCMQSN
jgi:hypothetical protein